MSLSTILGRGEPGDQLASAILKLASGELAQACQLASEVAQRAVSSADWLTAGRAEFLQAQAEVIASNFPQAQSHLQPALEHFTSARALVHYSEALSLSCFAASAQGHDIKALQRGHLSVKLLDDGPIEGTRLTALNYLGVALFWAGQFDNADQILEIAMWTADELGSVPLGYQPRINRASTEAFRQVTLRHLHQQVEDPERLLELLTECQSLAHSGLDKMLTTGTLEVSLVILDALSSMASSWLGDFESAASFLEASDARATCLSQSSWLRALTLLARAELAWKQQEWHAASAACQAVVLQGKASGHRHVESLGYQVLSDVCEASGALTDALAARRMAAECEREMRQGDLEHAESLTALLFEHHPLRVAKATAPRSA